MTRTKEHKKAKPTGRLQTIVDDYVPLIITFPLDFSALAPQDGHKPRKVKHSRIRVQLNRPMVWGEVEDITHKGLQFKLSVSADKQHLWVEGPMDSRQMNRIVAKVLAENYVNLFPRAVRTFSEYSGPWPQ